MHLPKWRLLTWWQKTQITSGLAFFVSIALALVTVTWTTSSIASPQSKSQLALAIFPVFVVVLMGLVSRIQQRTDFRNGPARSDDEQGPL